MTKQPWKIVECGQCELELTKLYQEMDALGIRGQIVTDETMLVNLRAQSVRLAKLLAEAITVLGKEG